MASLSEIIQLCRLCLVKDHVNISIFDDPENVRQIPLKISSCLPVKISRDDNLPKKICDGCSSKLDLCYDFWTSTAQAEKTLLCMAKEKENQVPEAVIPQPLLLKVEPAESLEETQICEPPVPKPIIVKKEVEPAPTSIENEAEEPAAKRPRRSAAIKAQMQIAPESDDDDDAAEGLCTTEDVADVEDDIEDPDIPDMNVEIDDVKPGPSGLNQRSADSEFFDTSILNNLIYGPGISITPIKPEIRTHTASSSCEPTIFPTEILRNGFNKFLEPQVKMSESVEISKTELDQATIQNNFLDSLMEIDLNPVKIKQEPDIDIQPNILDCLLSKDVKRKRKTGIKLPSKQPPPIDLDEPIECDVCNETFKNNVAFALHSNVHSQDNKYYCHLCDFKNSSKYHIEMHVRAHEGTTKYKCEICGKAFTISTHALEHKYYHTGEKPFQCEICGKHFMFSWFLTSHRRTQHWEIVTGSPLVKYDCTICNKHYTSSTGLKRHNMTHHGSPGIDQSVLCDICGKSLSSKEKLKFHRRIHTGYKPYACEICTKSFSRKEQLKEHERVHTGEKPYICKYCGKGFTQRSPLRIHERTHTGERPYKCMICQKGFISKGVMDTHMKSCSMSRAVYEPQIDF